MSLRYFEVGAVTSLMTMDIYQIENAFRFIPVAIQVPGIVLAISAIVYFTFGLLCLVIPSVFLLNFLMQYCITSQMSQLTKERLFIADKRAKLMSESLTGIKNVKFNAWEDTIEEKANSFRKEESSKVEDYFRRRITFDGVGNMISIIIISIMLILYSLGKDELDIGDTLALIACGNMLTFPSKILVVGMNFLKNASVSYQRVERFLKVPKIEIKQSINSDLKLGSTVLRNISSGWNVKITIIIASSSS